MKNGSAIGFLKDGTIPEPYQLDSPPILAISIGDYIYVSTKTATTAFNVDPETLRLTPRTDFGSMMPVVRAVDAGYIYAQPAPVKIDADKVAQGIITQPSRFTKSAREAYEALDGAAANNNLCWLPMLVYVTALTADGNTIFRTEPVLLTHPSGKTFDGKFTYNSAPGSPDIAVAAEVTAPAWRPRLCIPEALREALPDGAMLRVMASPPLRCHDTVRMPPVMPRRSAGDPVATVTLDTRSSKVMEAVGRLDAVMKPVFTVRNPRDVGEFDILCVPYADTKASRTVSSGSSSVVATASGAAVAADVVVWAAPALARPNPPAAECLAAVLDGVGAWHAAVAVEFADGSSQITLSEGTEGAPMLFSPLISYPAPDAVAISITVSAGGTVRSGRYPLVTDSSGTRSVYLRDDSLLFALPDRLPAFVVPPALPAVTPKPRALAVAAAAAPLTVRALAEPGDGDIIAVTPAVMGQSSWEFGRSRFFVFSTAGTYLLNVDLAGARTSLTLIDTRVIRSPSAFVRVDDALAAIASGDIVLISGTRFRRIATIPEAVALAWNHTGHELWCLTPDHVEVIRFDDSYSRYKMLHAYSPEVCNTGGESYLTSQDGHRGNVVVAGQGSSVPPVRCEWSKTLTMPSNFCRLVADIPGRYKSLSIEVTRTDGSVPAPAPDARIQVSGRVSAPVRFPVMLPPMASKTVVVKIVADADSSARLNSVSFEKLPFTPFR